VDVRAAELLLEPGMGAPLHSDPDAVGDASAEPLSVFYPAKEFKLFARQPIALPDYMQMSNNYFDKRWSGHRRVKNVVVVMDWVPNRDAATRRTQPHACAPPTGADALLRTLSLLEHTPKSSKRSPALTRAAIQMLIDCNFELSRTGRESLDLPAVGLEYDAVARRMAGPELRTEDERRYSVALSLIEAETILCAEGRAGKHRL
jgi:hypothetical protein